MIYHQIRFSVKLDTPRDRVEAALELMRRLGRELDVVELPNYSPRRTWHRGRYRITSAVISEPMSAPTAAPAPARVA
jgi:hypothetical protein